MLTRTLATLGNPGTFDLTDKTDPGYYIARFSHEMSLNLYNLSTDGFQFEQPVASDFDNIETSFETYSDDFYAWSVNAVAAAEAGLPIPTPPDSPTLPPSTLPGFLVTVVIKLAINLAVRWLEKKLDPNTDALEIARVLKQAFVGEHEGEEFPLMEALKNTPLEIIINKRLEYQDFVYE